MSMMPSPHRTVGGVAALVIPTLVLVATLSTSAAAYALAPQRTTTIPSVGCGYDPYDATTLHPLPGGDLVVQTRREVIRLDADANVRWRHVPPTACNPDGSGADDILDVAHDIEGASWIARQRGSFYAPNPDHAVSLHRLSAFGSIDASLPLPSDTEGRRVTSLRMAAIGTTMAALVTWQHPEGWPLPRLEWIRFDAMGIVLHRHDIAIADARSDIWVETVETLGGGDMRVVARHRNSSMCPPLLMCDDHNRHTVLRLAPDGTERWRHQEPHAESIGASQPDGSAWFVFGHGVLQPIDGDGQLSPSISNSHFANDEDAYSAHGPIDGRVLVASSFGLRLLDMVGQQVAARLIPTAPVWNDVNWNIHALTATSTGFLLPQTYSSGDCALALLLHPANLQDRFRLDSGLGCNDDAPLAFTHTGIAVTPDGWVHIATRHGPHIDEEIRGGFVASDLDVLTFGLPGTTAGGLIFRDDFDECGETDCSGDLRVRLDPHDTGRRAGVSKRRLDLNGTSGIATAPGRYTAFSQAWRPTPAARAAP